MDTKFNEKNIQLQDKLNRPHPNWSKSREWSTQCLKIIENFYSYDDAKLLCSPLDPITHEDYYTMTDEPLDLLKIELNLHGAKYPSIDDFKQDIEQMFDQYKRYFSNKDIKIYDKIEKLETIFEIKLDKIPKFTKNNLYNDKSEKPKIVLPNKDMISERIQRIQEENERILKQATIPKIINKSKFDQISTNKRKYESEINYSIQFPESKRQIIIPNQNKPKVVIRSPIVYVSPKNSSMESEFLDESGSQSDRCLEREMEKAGVQVLLNVTSIWFGASRQLPIAPIIVRENGFYMRFLIEDREDTLVDFQIPAYEIVRCCGYHGNFRKNTIFIFLLPSCVTRMIDSKLISGVDVGSEMSLHATIVALFMPALREDDMAKLIYILWSMGKRSLFKSTDFYSEIDQTVALKLMSNTNPNINKNDIPIKHHQTVTILNTKNRISTSNSTNLKNKRIFVPNILKKHNQEDCITDDENCVLQIKEEPLDEETTPENSSHLSSEMLDKSGKIEEQYSIFQCIPNGHGGYTLTRAENNDNEFKAKNRKYSSVDNLHIAETDISHKEE